MKRTVTFRSNPALARAALALAIAALPASLPLQAQQSADFSQALKELSIMENIFDATLEADGRARGPRFSGGPDALYLAGQGMVFSFRLAGGWRGDLGYWEDFGASMSRMAEEIAAGVANAMQDIDLNLPQPLPPAPPAPPLASFGGTSSEQLRAEREELRERANALRETQREMMEQQRQMRRLQRQMRGAEPDAQLEGELAALEAELDRLGSELDQQSEAYAQAQQALETQRQQLLSERSTAMAQEVVSTLCDYGRTLRSLQDDEHITLIFEDFAEDEDQVMVFDWPAVRDCDTPDALLNSALRYTM